MKVICVAAALAPLLVMGARAQTQEPIFGLPCEGCGAVFQGLPAALTPTARITPAQGAGSDNGWRPSTRSSPRARSKVRIPSGS
jgi:hypothetical protein